MFFILDYWIWEERELILQYSYNIWTIWNIFLYDSNLFTYDSEYINE